MAGLWWYPGPRDGETVPDYPPVYLGEAVDETLRFPTDETAKRVAFPAEKLTFTFTADTTRWDAAMRQLLLALAVRFTAVCPGCRRDTHWLDYDLEAESCRACLDVIPRLQFTMRSAHVDWAPISPQLHWRTSR